MQKSLAHALEGALVALLGAVPAIVASSTVQHLIETHPWVAVYVPVATGLAAALYNMLKPKAHK